MIDFQQKRKVNRFLYSKFTLFGLLVILIFLGRSTYDIYTREQLSRTDYEGVKKDYDGLVQRQEMLTSEIARLKTDNGVDEEIRSKFSVAKPGETVVVIIDSSSSTSSDHGGTASVWSRFTSWFQ